MAGWENRHAEGLGGDAIEEAEVGLTLQQQLPVLACPGVTHDPWVIIYSLEGKYRK